MHGNITELITEQAPQTHEGGGISDDLLRVGDNFIPVRRSWAGEQAQRPLSSAGQSPAGQPRPCREKHFVWLLWFSSLTQLPLSVFQVHAAIFKFLHQIQPLTLSRVHKLCHICITCKNVEFVNPNRAKILPLWAVFHNTRPDTVSRHLETTYYVTS